MVQCQASHHSHHSQLQEARGRPRVGQLQVWRHAAFGPLFEKSVSLPPSWFYPFINISALAGMLL